MNNYAAKLASYYSTDENPLSQERALQRLCEANGGLTPAELQEKVNRGEPIKEPGDMSWNKDVQKMYVPKPNELNNNYGETGESGQSWANYPQKIAGLFMGASDPNKQDFNFTQLDGVDMPFAAGADYRLTSPFSDRENPTGPGREFHEGVDFGAAKNTPVYATSDGVAKLFPDQGRGYGNQVNIYDNNGNYNLYGHLSGFNITQGQSIRRGDLIGYVGSTGRSTGMHLHYGVYINGSPVNPLKRR